jgi:hypothetical protein
LDHIRKGTVSSVNYVLFQFFKYLIIFLLICVYSSMFHMYINKCLITSMCCIISFNIWWNIDILDVTQDVVSQNLTNDLHIISNNYWCMRTIRPLHQKGPEDLQEIQHYYSLFSNLLYHCIDNKQHWFKSRNIRYIMRFVSACQITFEYVFRTNALLLFLRVTAKMTDCMNRTIWPENRSCLLLKSQ